MTKVLQTLVLVCAPFLLLANMASPYRGGSGVNEALTSLDIDIVSEQIQVRILDKYRVQYRVAYNVRSDREGRQVPLVFDTKQSEYRGFDMEFKVWVDGREVEVGSLSDQNDTVKAFADSLNRFFNTVDDRWNLYNRYRYFEVDLSAGEHTIEVQYLAEAQISTWGMVKEYAFIYNLEPAHRWRSFGQLDVEVDASAFPHSVDVEFDSTVRVDSIARWHFDSLPQDEFVIRYNPPIGTLAKVLIWIDPAGLTFLFSLLLMWWHWKAMRSYRGRYPYRRFSWVMLVGSFALMLVVSIAILLFTELTDWVIGDEASGRHGYIILFVIMIYILFQPLYLLVALGMDFVAKRNAQRKRAMED